MERCFRLLFCINLNSSLPFVFVSLDPQKVCLCIKVSSGNEAVSECPKEAVIIIVLILMFWRAVDRRACCFSYLVFKRDASSLYVVLFIFGSYVVFDVLSNYSCGTSVCCLVWVSGVIYVVVWYFHVAPLREVCF